MGNNLTLHGIHHIVITCCWLLAALCFFLGSTVTSDEKLSGKGQPSLLGHIRLVTVQSTLYAAGGLLLTVSFIFQVLSLLAGREPLSIPIIPMVTALAAYLAPCIIIPMLRIHRYTKPESLASIGAGLERNRSEYEFIGNVRG